MRVRCFVIFVILVVVVELSLASASAEQQIIADKPTPTPSPISELANLSFKLGIAYQQAQLCHNVTAFNSMVDEYNAWVRQHFGEGADALLMSKMPVPSSLAISPPLTGGAQKQQVLPEIPYLTKNPFNASSDLSKFGKPQVFRDLPSGEEQYIEEASVYQKLKNF